MHAFSFQMSIEERLSAISTPSADLPSSSGAAQPPKADTLARLLTQGLQSQDSQILSVISLIFIPLCMLTPFLQVAYADIPGPLAQSVTLLTADPGFATEPGWVPYFHGDWS